MTNRSPTRSTPWTTFIGTPPATTTRPGTVDDVIDTGEDVATDVGGNGHDVTNTVDDTVDGVGGTRRRDRQGERGNGRRDRRRRPGRRRRSRSPGLASPFVRSVYALARTDNVERPPDVCPRREGARPPPRRARPRRLECYDNRRRSRAGAGLGERLGQAALEATKSSPSVARPSSCSATSSRSTGPTEGPQARLRAHRRGPRPPELQ